MIEEYQENIVNAETQDKLEELSGYGVLHIDSMSIS